MIVSIMQPAFLPWLGYFNRLLLSERHVVLDHVQIDKSSKTNFANRNKIRTPTGWMWLTVPLVRKGQSGKLRLDQIQIAEDATWARKAWASITHNYRHAAHFDRYAPLFEPIFRSPATHLHDLNQRLTQTLLAAFGIETEMLSSARLPVSGAKDALILEICQAVGATRYISGPFGRAYLDAASFKAAGIELLFHDYVHPQYRQAHPGFEPYMSALDLLFNHGPGSRSILSIRTELATS